ncbi:MAG: ArsR/SmtB family transcription factor [Smithellaceae bacterium]
MDSIYKLQADVCKTFANDKRLEIINLLKEREMSNSELMQKTGLPKVNISQHMNVLKTKGVVLARRDGIQLYYRIANPKIIQACNLMREVLMDQLVEKEKMTSRLIKASNKKTKVKTKEEDMT